MTNGPIMRAALTLMDRWFKDGISPPASIVPLRKDGTLVSPEHALDAFPDVPGFETPEAPSRLPLYDYGPGFGDGLVTQHPPLPIPGQEYDVQVPLVDADGNDLGGLRSPEIAVPVGTHTGWNLRRTGFGAGDFASLAGSFVPFARTQSEREENRDPRLSIEERYGSYERYFAAIGAAAKKLQERGFLLQEDVDRYIAAAEGRNPLDETIDIAPLALSIQGALDRMKVS